MFTLTQEMTVYFGIDTRALEKNISGAINKTLEGIKTLPFTIAPFEALITLFTRGLQFGETALKASQLAESLGVSAQECYAFLEIAKQSGIEINSFMEDAIQLKQKVEQAFTDPKIDGHFKKIDVAIRDAEGNARPYAQILANFIESTQNLRNIKPEEKNSILASYRALGQDDKNTKAYARSRVTETTFNELVTTAPDANVIKNYSLVNNALKQFNEAFQSLSRSVSDVTGKIFIAIASSMEKLARWIAAHDEIIFGFFGGLVAWMGILAATALANPMTWIILGVAAAVTVLAYIIKDFFTYLRGGNSDLKNTWRLLGDNEEAARRFALVIYGLKKAAPYIFEEIKTNFKSIFYRIMAPLKAIISLIELIQSAYYGIKSIFTDEKKDKGKAVGAVKGGFKGIGLAFADIIGIGSGIRKYFINDKDETKSTNTKLTEPSSFSAPAPSSLDAFPAAARGSMYNSSSQNSVTTGDIIVNANTSDPQALGGAVAARIQKYDTYLQDKTRANANYGFAG